MGKDVHCVSDNLVRMRVFDANGELRTYSADGDGGDVELFRAVSAGFGCFGVVYDVTIQVSYFRYKDKIIIYGHIFSYSKNLCVKKRDGLCK